LVNRDEAPVRRIHLDTDIGGDTDDLCARDAAWLAWCGTRGRNHLHRLRWHASRTCPLRAEARRVGGCTCDGRCGWLAGGFYRDPPSLSDLERNWPEPVAPEPSPPGAALDLLARSVEMGATIVGVGPWTNLALLEVTRPGLLASTQLVVMGGYVSAVRAGLPAWEPDMDYNVQQDTLVARIGWERCDPLVVQLSVTLESTLREAHLPQLREGGALARLIARQGELYGADSDMSVWDASIRDYPTTSSTSTTTRSRARSPPAGTVRESKSSSSRRGWKTGCSRFPSHRAASQPASLLALTARGWSGSGWRWCARWEARAEKLGELVGFVDLDASLLLW
jgi:hypothetical protein